MADNRSYREKLLDGRWQKRRLEILERDNWSCKKCGESAETGTVLHVHHRRYIANREPWDYPHVCLISLCSDCHKEESENLEMDSDILIAQIRDRFFASDISQIAGGFYAMTDELSYSDVAFSLGWLLTNQAELEDLISKWRSQLKPFKFEPDKEK